MIVVIMGVAGIREVHDEERSSSPRLSAYRSSKATISNPGLRGEDAARDAAQRRRLRAAPS